MDPKNRSRQYDRGLLASKIQWEGGVAATLDYGLRAADIADPTLRSAWTKLQAIHARMRPLITEFEELLRQPAPDRTD